MNAYHKNRLLAFITLLLLLGISTTSSSAQNPPNSISGTTERVSVASDGTQGNKESRYTSISADGRYVAYNSDASNLVVGDTNGSTDIFVHDRTTGETTRVSIASNGSQGNRWSSGFYISGNGRYVAFDSLASNLVAGDTNNVPDVFVHDRQTGETTRVSIASDGSQGNGACGLGHITPDGRFVVFESDASNLVPGDTNNNIDVFVHDRLTGVTTIASVSSDGTQGNWGGNVKDISADGRYVVFASYSSNLVPGDTNDEKDVFVYDRQTHETSRISVASDGTQGNNFSDQSSISADGRYVAFESLASNLVVGDTNYIGDVFVHDLTTGQTTRVSIASDGSQGNDGSWLPMISADGRFVVFESYATNLVPVDTNNHGDVFVHDLVTGETTLVSIGNDSTQGNNDSLSIHGISADGRYVAFYSYASNLVPGDTNNFCDTDNDGTYNDNCPDVFVRDRTSEIRYSISGRVMNIWGMPISNVTISAGEGHTAVTDIDGNYRITNLLDTSYTITPSMSSYTFSPLSKIISVPPSRFGVNFTGIPLFVKRFEVNQVLGNQKNDEQNYVAGKATALRVILNWPIKTDPASQKIVVKRDGVLMTELYPRLRPVLTDELEFLCPTMFNCNFWPVGTYTFEVSINGISYQSSSYDFVKSKDLRILAIPIKIRFNERELLPDDSWKTGDEFLKKVYPISSLGVNWKEGPIFDATAYDIKNVINESLIVGQLDLMNILCGHCYDHIIGFIANICNPTEDCPVGGTYPLFPDVSIVMTTEDMQASVAHEIGHKYGLGDEYGRTEGYPNMCGAFKCNINPAPPEYCGRNGDLLILPCIENYKCSDLTVVPYVSQREKASGAKVRGISEEQDYPYDVTGEGKLADMLSFMGSDELERYYWITPDIYHQLFSELTSVAQIQSATSDNEMVIQASGLIGIDGTVILNPWSAYLSTTPTQIIGTYTIDALDASNIVLASQGFNVSFLLLSDPPIDLDIAPFQVTIPFPSGTKSFQIRQGNDVLYNIKVSANSPVVNVISPNGGESWGSSGDATITWSGIDVDGDTLYYTVLYTPNGTDWETIATNLATTQTNIALNEIPGGVAAKIKVIATDGINTTSDVSDGTFVVGEKGPNVYILSPLANSVIPNGTSFYLNGYAYDQEDGALSDAAFQWSSDKDGFLGTGQLILVDLSFGYHLVTLTAIDSDGNTASDTIQLFIGNRIFLPLSLK